MKIILDKKANNRKLVKILFLASCICITMILTGGGGEIGGNSSSYTSFYQNNGSDIYMPDVEQ